MAERLCHCGTCQDAIDVAFKLLNQMLDNDCPGWAIQVSIAMSCGAQMIATGAVDQLNPESTLVRERFERIMAVMAPDLEKSAAQLTELRDKTAKMVESVR